MSYPTLIQSFPSPLRAVLQDPIAIAAIASVGIHGLLWVVLPRLDFSAAAPREPDLQRQVGLIELTPQEQSRLPQFGDSTLPLSIDSLPLPSAPSTGQLPDLFSLAPLPIPQPIPYPPASFYIPPVNLTQPRIYTVPTTPRRSIPRSTTLTPAPTLTPTPTPSSTPTPPIALTDILRRNELPEQLNGRTTARIPNLQPPSPSPTNQAAVLPTSPTLTPQERLLAENRQLREEYRQLRRSYSLQGTTEEDARQSFVTWYRELGKELDGNPPIEQITAPYPRAACLLRRSTAAIYGVVINSNSEIVGEPRLLQSSGYPIFNREALEAVKSHTFNNGTSDDQTYLTTVTFEFSRDVCPGVPMPAPAPPS
jgi:outer membrane biosynthesis protein TonB